MCIIINKYSTQAAQNPLELFTVESFEEMLQKMVEQHTLTKWHCIQEWKKVRQAGNNPVSWDGAQHVCSR
jgi:hypothetical protein